MTKKLRVGVLFGGRSGEHEISLLSAASILQAMDRNKYEIIPIGITREGRWVTAQDAERLLAGSTASGATSVGAAERPPHPLRAGDPAATRPATVLAVGNPVVVPPIPDYEQASILPLSGTGLGPSGGNREVHVDIVFPVLHGTFGEDGTIQGLLELADVAYVGAGVLGSAAGMDKAIMKELFRAAGLPIVKHVSFLRRDWERQPQKVRRLVESSLKYPVFTKPANLGSSVGIQKVRNRQELEAGIREAARFDRKIVVEEGVGGARRKAREIECSVLGNDEPIASVAGEIVPATEFYDYSAKYLDEGSELLIPAKLTKAEQKKVQQLAIRSFQAVDCSGLARVDFLMDPKTRRIYVNEINTMPGFTQISMYPKLWAATGMSYPELIDRLLQLGLERHQERKKNQYSR